MARRKPAAKAAAPRKPRAKKGPPFSARPRAEPTPEELWKMIAEAAYFKARAREFAPGREVEDWIEAEAEVMRRLGRG